MPDLTVAPYRKGKALLDRGFDVGTGPSRDLDKTIETLEYLVEEEDLDASLVARVAWMQDWEDLVLGDEPRDQWTREEAGETITAFCAPDELARIIEAMTTLRAHVRKERLASWDQMTAFLSECAKDGGTVCLWYDPMG